MATGQAIDEAKLNEFMGRAVGDIGAGISAALVVLGDRLGLYKALAEGGGLTSTELARRTGTAERYVREWLDNQAAGGFVTYDAAKATYALPAEQAMALADDASPAFLPGAFQIVQAAFAAIPRIEERFKSGGGLEWGEQHPCLFEGTERFFRSGYVGNLVDKWLPALDGVVPKLQAGAKVADIGCGHGASTILMAKAFPNSTFFGFDSHADSVRVASQRAAAAGLSDRVKFQVAGAGDFPGTGYDLIAHFDCLHDMADPLGAARQARKAIAKDGTWLIVEPAAGDRPEQNHNPVGRVFYGASTVFCVPCSLAQRGPALGAQAGQKRISAVVSEGGFGKVRKATETPFNLILEARP